MKIAQNFTFHYELIITQIENEIEPKYGLYISLWTNYNYILGVDDNGKDNFTFHYELIITINVLLDMLVVMTLHFTMN